MDEKTAQLHFVNKHLKVFHHKDYGFLLFFLIKTKLHSSLPLILPIGKTLLQKVVHDRKVKTVKQNNPRVTDNIT